MQIRGGNLEKEIKKAYHTADEKQIGKRLYDKDQTLWINDPEQINEINHRLVWLSLPDNFTENVENLIPFYLKIKEEGIRDVYVEEEKMFRITMTAPLINKARTILFLVTGENKAEMLKKVLSLPYLPDKIPAQLIKPTNGKLFWFVDKDAASLL